MENKILGWPSDKNLSDFLDIVKNLSNEGQESRSAAMLYLIERCRIAESRIESLQSANQWVRVKDRLPTVYLSDLLDVIHFTIIKKLGRNDFLLKQVQEMEYIIKYEMGNLDVNDTEMWNSIINKYMSAAPVKEGE